MSAMLPATANRLARRRLPEAGKTMLHKPGFVNLRGQPGIIPVRPVDAVDAGVFNARSAVDAPWIPPEQPP
ncbi:MAG: hypothetical protein KJ049_08250 [Gammaproteobacteria bacterium]|nr:hypothetical protein [Gammaproteobacteria bacterium]